MCNRLDRIPACDGRTDGHLATVKNMWLNYYNLNKVTNYMVHSN